MGFTFDDTDKKGIATPLSEMRRLTSANPNLASRIFPYLGGEELNDSSTHEHHRYVINFEDWPLKRSDLGETWRNASDEKRKAWLYSGIVPSDYYGPVAADFPELLEIVEQNVKPAREQQDDDFARKCWWRFLRPRPELNSACRGLQRVLVTNAQASPHLCVAFSKPTYVFANSLNVFPLQDWHAFTLLQSRVHEIWARFMCSSMKDDLRYNPTDCFDTFPFPEESEHNPQLEAVGRSYYDFRADLMVRNGEGLTKAYNRFHNPNEQSRDVKKLRELHDAMDRAVLDAYGWSDLRPVCESFPEFEEDSEDQESGRTRIKKYRYRWPDEIHDEVLARLLALNQQRAAVPSVDTEPPSSNGKAPRRPKKPRNPNHSLFESQLT